ncbi:MAG: hypothetical protein EBW87_03985 [Burkholderiaceae bacterium]|nr:hypothetical protein [Burkholderiaceae bacterium]
MNVSNILSEQFKDLISEDTLKQVEEAFNTAVDEKSKAKIQLEVENVKAQLDEHYTGKLQELTEKIDEDHTAKMQKLVAAIDTDHAVKLHNLVESIDAKHTKMLKQVVEKYEGKLVADATSFQNRLVEEISNYLDLYLDKTVPTAQINEAVTNIQAAAKLHKIRQLVGIDEEFVDNEVKEALIDGKRTIDSLRNELNVALKENVDLAARANKAEVAILLEDKTVDMPAAKKTFVHKLLKNKSPEYIKENFDYVVEMFEKEAQTDLETIQEQVKQEFVSQTASADRPHIIEEQKNFNNEVERDASSEVVSGYLNEMKKISNSRIAR